MKLIRHLNKELGEYQFAIEQNKELLVLEAKQLNLSLLLNQSQEEILQTYEYIKTEAVHDRVIPFHPAAYRDFMLYEKHAINAARGFARKYMPKLYPIARTIEKIMGKPLRKLRPANRYYKYPIYYLGNHLNFITHNDSINIPTYTEELDYELEIAALISKPLKNASLEEAKDAIGAYVILNDFSARDIQIDEMQSGFGPMKSKNFGSSISNVVVSRDEIHDRIEQLKVKVFINEQLIVETNTEGKLYSFEEAIAYASWEEQLHPGELFGSGTIPMCTGIENGRMLKKGDQITLEVEGMGILSNTVV